jgi:hypothetical protein
MDPNEAGSFLFLIQDTWHNRKSSGLELGGLELKSGFVTSGKTM